MPALFDLFPRPKDDDPHLVPIFFILIHSYAISFTLRRFLGGMNNLYTSLNENERVDYKIEPCLSGRMCDSDSTPWKPGDRIA